MGPERRGVHLERVARDDGADAGGAADVVDGGGDGAELAARREAQVLRPQVAGDLDRHRRAQGGRAVGEVQLAGRGGAGHGDDDRRRLVVGQQGAVDLQGREGAGGRHPAGRVGVRPVQQVLAGVRRRGRHPVDRVQDRVDLRLVRRQLAAALAGAVGGGADQRLQLGQQRADLGQATGGGPDHVVGHVGVGDGGVDPGLLVLEVVGLDQAGRVIGAGVDPQARAQPGQARLQRLVVLGQGVLGNQRANVGVDRAHGNRVLP